MELSHYLNSAELLGCHGEVTHRLLLLPDGNVQVQIGSITAVIDPTRRKVMTPVGYQVPDQVLDYACTLARTGN